MKIKTTEFLSSATRPSHYPAPIFPEVAFAGRSNAGKSTLLNMLLNRKALARVSRTPGRTQLINFFVLNKSYYLVDLPGYGYAKVPNEVRRDWGPMMNRYVSSRENLRGMVMVLDMRRIPSGEDLILKAAMESVGLPLIVAATKADKLSKNKLYPQHKAIAAKLGLSMQQIFPFSGKNGMGKENLWKAIDRCLLPPLYPIDDEDV